MPAPIDPRVIVAAAKRYEGEPYRHRGRNQFGRDCLGLLLAVLKDTGQIDPNFDFHDYTKDVTRYVLEREMNKHLLRLAAWHDAEPGDVVLQKFHLSYPASHIVIITNKRAGQWWGMHNSLVVGRCVEQRLAHHERNFAAYRLPGVNAWLK